MSDETIDRTKLPFRRPAFSGVASETLGGSQPDWLHIGHVKPPEGAPNVLVVLIDDAGSVIRARSAGRSILRTTIGSPVTGCGITGFM